MEQVLINVTNDSSLNSESSEEGNEWKMERKKKKL